MSALAQTFAAATVPLAAMACDADRANRLGDAWRENLRRIEDHLLFIPQHVETVAFAHGRKLSQRERRHVEHCRARLADRLPKYLACVRRVSEAESEMDRLGIAYARSSYAWADAARDMARAA